MAYLTSTASRLPASSSIKPSILAFLHRHTALTPSRCFWSSRKLNTAVSKVAGVDGGPSIDTGMSRGLATGGGDSVGAGSIFHLRRSASGSIGPDYPGSPAGRMARVAVETEGDSTAHA